MLNKSHIPEIKRLLAKGLTDREIGAVYGTTKSCINKFRVTHNIPTHRRQGLQPEERFQRKEEAVIEHPLKQIIENGIIISLCPARWAHGVWPQKNLRCYE